jgi:rod shape-determining protein MreC
MAVIAPGGIVGHVIKGFDWSAQVLLVIDRSSAVDALVQRTRFRGIIEGETDETCRFKYVVRKADVKIGDTVISSGLDGLFPKGLPVSGGYSLGYFQAQVRAISGSESAAIC